MKQNNKGFSLVELIIVIAIMAILAGALAPQLIKYLDKARKSTDVQTAQTIATAVNASLANEKAYDAVTAGDKMILTNILSGTNAFSTEMKGIIGSNTPKPKFDASGKDFYIEFGTGKSFKIYITDATTPAPGITNEVYPTVGTDYQ